MAPHPCPHCGHEKRVMECARCGVWTLPASSERPASTSSAPAPAEDYDEPTCEGWRAFLATPEGRSLNPRERRTLAIFGCGGEGTARPRTVAFYRGVLELDRELVAR